MNLNINKHIINIAFNVGAAATSGSMDKIDVHSEFEDYIEQKAIDFEINRASIQEEYNVNDYYDLIDLYSERVISQWSNSYRCGVCGKFITDDEGMTTLNKVWVCNNDTCRYLDKDNQAIERFK